MHKQHLLRVGVCLVALCALLYTPKVPVVYAWSDADYFNAVVGCDSTYSGTLSECRAFPFYPFEPTETQCRFAAGNEYSGCLYGIPPPAYEPDFCDGARATYYNCTAEYGPGSGNEDLGAVMNCRVASGIDLCE